MKTGRSGQMYLDFDEYIRLGEPEQQEKAANWSIAIGLQAVDGLKPSEYLVETAKRNIEGEISLDETQKLIHNYYISKQKRDTPDDSDSEEADRVSANIARGQYPHNSRIHHSVSAFAWFQGR